ncbi:hypothetical protein CIB84_016596 [Bambusicola thoracicus]|uniref:Uncharacterized protein n=1 Tax=Bambusicola thoracicus TaxID=9083 RepID=A0A2P4S6D2_BAMTH|nr:hypothetical protein CIB84_016596 [Bambusicola thoracicus]
MPDVHSSEDVAGDLSPAADKISDIKEDLPKSGAAERHWGSASMRENSRNVQGGLEQGEHFRKPLGNHLGKRVRNPPGCSLDRE